MSPAVDVKHSSSTASMSALAPTRRSRSGAREQHLYPDPVPPGWTVGCRRLPSLPGGSQELSQAFSRLRSEGRGRHGGYHQVRPPAALPPDHPGAAVRGTQPCLLGMRHNNHCELQATAQSQGLTHVRLPYRSPGWAWMHPMSALSPTRTAASCARDACASATRSKAPRVGCDGRGIDSMVITDLMQPWGESSCTRAASASTFARPARSSTKPSRLDHPKYPDFVLIST